MKKIIAAMLICLMFTTQAHANTIHEHEKEKGTTYLENTYDPMNDIFHDVTIEPIKQVEIIDACYEFGVEPKLLFSIGYVESHWTEDICNSHGATGMFQIIPQYATDFSWSGCNYYDCVDNSIVSMGIIKYYLDKYGSYDAALQAYNTGSPNGNPIYSSKVMSVYSGLK